MVKTALIIGANSQDGSYLIEFLLEKGYIVHGTVRRNSVSENQSFRINHLLDKIQLHYCDLTDPGSINNIINKVKPDELYHLGAQSAVGVSFDLPLYTLNTNAGGTLAVLEAVKNFSPHTKVYFACTSEVYGNNIDADGYQRETTPMIPVSPYGASKLYGYNLCHNYRNAYGLFVSCGILFNHESPRRGSYFVTNKVCKAAVDISKGKIKELRIGNLHAARDWGNAKEYVEAMWRILQLETPDNFICATGISHTVEELCQEVFSQLNLDWRKYVKSVEKYKRPEELHYLKGDSTKLYLVTGFKPKVTFEKTIKEMVNFHLNGKE